MNLRSLLPDREQHRDPPGRRGSCLIALVPCLFLLGVTAYFSRRSLEATVRQRLMVICDAKAAQLEEFVGQAEGRRPVPVPRARVHRGRGPARRLVKEGKAGTEEYRRVRGAAAPPGGLRRRQLVREPSSFRHRRGAADLLPGRGSTSALGWSRGRSRGRSWPGRSGGPGRCSSRSWRTCSSTRAATPASSFIVGPVLKDGAMIGGGRAGTGLDRRSSGVVQHLFRPGRDRRRHARDGRGDEITYVAPTRFNPSAAFKDRLRIGSAAGKDMQSAVTGNRGYGEMLDHTGTWVVTAWTYLPSYRWGITVKQDSSEAFELLRKQRQAVAVFMADRGPGGLRRRQVGGPDDLPADPRGRPVAERVAAGDLTARVEIAASGEAGKLLQAVETMTGDLRSLIGRIQQSSIALMSTATEIAATARQQGEAVNDYGASTSEAAAAVKEISATSLELLKTMNEVNEVAGHTASMASDGQGASPRWAGRCGTWPTRRPRSAPSSRSSASAPPTSTWPSPRSPRWPTRPTCSRSTRRSRPRRPANTAWASSSSPARSAAWPTRPPWPPSTSSGWSRRCSTASRPA